MGKSRENEFLQEVRSSVSEKRKNVHSFNLFGNGSAEDLLGRREQKVLRSESNFSFRKSLAWDNAFFTSPGILDPQELFGTLNSREVENAIDILEPMEQNSLPPKSLEHAKTSRNGECSTRKSLAWDTAFFTSAGVLDPEELSMVNKGFKKSEMHLVPRTEALWMSAETNSTMHSDSLSLTGLEIDLFEDIRASVHYSSKSSNVATSSSKLKRGKCTQKIHASKKESSSRIGMKSKPSSTRQRSNTHGLDIIKEAYVPPRAQHAVRSGESNPFSSLKPPKISIQAKAISAAPTKRASWGSNNVKMEHKIAKAASGQHLIGSKKHYLRDSCSAISTSTPSPKSGISCPLSLVSCKSPTKSLKEFGCGHVSSNPALRTPLRYSTRNKTELGNSGYLTHSLPMPKSYCTSPANSLDSSVDECSSESSSSMNQKSQNSKVGPHNTPRRGVIFGSDRHPHNQSCVGDESREARVPNQYVKNVSIRTPTNVSRNFKPSGLRMPSPKIGFFDESTVPGTGICNLQPERTSAGSGNMKLASWDAGVQCTTLSSRPAHRDYATRFEEENTYPLLSAVSGKTKNYFSFTSDSQNDFSGKLGSQDCLDSKKSRMQTEKKRQVLRVKKQSSKEHEHEAGQLHPGNDKENIFASEDQVDSLSRKIGAINLSRDMEIEFNTRGVHFDSRFGINDIIHNTRTPLAAKDSTCNNRSVLLELAATEFAKEKTVEKTPPAFRSTENIVRK